MTKLAPHTAPISAGGRVDLRLDTPSSSANIEYEARFFVGDEAALPGRVIVPLENPRDVQIVSEAPLPDWLKTFTITLLRTLGRSAPPWPRRVTRWREER